VFSLEFWFTVAVVILVIELTAILIVLVVIAAGLGYGSEVIRNRLKASWMPLLQGYAAQGAGLTQKAAATVTAPPIRVKSQVAGLRHTISVLLGRR
jgi:hypothetical protein